MRRWIVLLAVLTLVPSYGAHAGKGRRRRIRPVRGRRKLAAADSGHRGLHVGFDWRRVRRDAGSRLDWPARHACAAGRRKVRRAAPGSGHCRDEPEMDALHLRRRSQRQARAVVDAARQDLRAERRARPAQDQDEPVRSAEARVGVRRRSASALQVQLRRQAGADVGRSGRSGRGRRATSAGRPTSTGCRTARSSSATATRTRAS